MLPVTTHRQQCYELGLDLHEVQWYDRAVLAFDKVLICGGKESRVYAARSASLEALDKLEEALLDARIVVELDPTSAHALIQASRLYDALGHAPHAHRALLAALPLSSAELQPALRAQLEFLSIKLASYQRTHVDLIQRLPSELLLKIGHLLVDAGKDAGFALAGVSRSWRVLFLEDRRMWSRLRLRVPGKAVSVQRVEWANERSRGAFVELELERIPSQLLKKIAPLLATSLSRVTRLSLRDLTPADLSCWHGRLGALRCFHTDQVQMSEVKLLMDLLPVGYRGLRDLNISFLGLHDSGPDLEQFLFIVAGLQHLFVGGMFRPFKSEVKARFCDAAAGLVSFCSSIFGESLLLETHSPHLSPRVFLKLEVLKVCSRGSRESCRAVSLPALCSFQDLDAADPVYRAYLLPGTDLISLLPPTFPLSTSPLLQHLVLDNPSFKLDLLLADLVFLPSIVHLELSSSYVFSSIISDKLIEGLTILPSSSGPLLPLLERLDLRGTMPMITGEPLLQLVASRRGLSSDRPISSDSSLGPSLVSTSQPSLASTSASGMDQGATVPLTDDGLAGSANRPGVARLKTLRLVSCAELDEAVTERLAAELDDFFA